MAQRRRPARPDDCYALSWPLAPTISPNGEWVAYVIRHAQREDDVFSTSVWVARVDGAAQPRQFAVSGGARSPRWSPRGDALAYVAQRDGTAQIMVAPLEGGEPRQLTTGPCDSEDPQWSPDGTAILCQRTLSEPRAAGRPSDNQAAPRVVTELYHKSDGVGFFDDRRRHLFIVDVATGETRQLTRGDWNDGDAIGLLTAG